MSVGICAMVHYELVAVGSLLLPCVVLQSIQLRSSGFTYGTILPAVKCQFSEVNMQGSLLSTFSFSPVSVAFSQPQSENLPWNYTLPECCLVTSWCVPPRTQLSTVHSVYCLSISTHSTTRDCESGETTQHVIFIMSYCYNFIINYYYY